jgi:hypothetical protein
MSALLSWGEAIRMRTHFEDAAMKRAQGIVDIFLPVIGIVIMTAFVLEKLVGLVRKVDKHTTKMSGV